MRLGGTVHGMPLKVHLGWSLMDLFSFDWSQFGTQLLRVLLAVLFALPIGWEREQAKSIAGLRTFPMVAVASCGYVLVALQTLPSPEAQSRVIQGLMTGIGFIGGGSIVKEGLGVRGTTTAASIWTTGAIGGAVGYGEWETALILSLVTYAGLRYLTRFKKKAKT